MTDEFDPMQPDSETDEDIQESLEVLNNFLMTIYNVASMDEIPEKYFASYNGSMTTYNPERYRDFQECYDAICRVFAGQNVTIEQNVGGIDGLTKNGAVTVCGKEIDIARMQEFLNIIASADNVEAMPLADNRIEMNFLFRDVLTRYFRDGSHI